MFRVTTRKKKKKKPTATGLLKHLQNETEPRRGYPESVANE